jgi:hypothetical protein
MVMEMTGWIGHADAKHLWQAVGFGGFFKVLIVIEQQ